MHVLLPEPLAPITATNSPRSIRRSTPRNASMAAVPVPYTFLTPRSSISGAPFPACPLLALIASHSLPPLPVPSPARPAR